MKEKPAPPKQKVFRVQTRRLAASFETFTVSVALTGPEKKYHAKPHAIRGFFLKFSKAARRQSFKGAPLRKMFKSTGVTRGLS